MVKVVDCKSIGFPALVRIQSTLINFDFFLLNGLNIYFTNSENLSFFKIYFDSMIITSFFNKNNLFLWCVNNDNFVFSHLYNYEINFFFKESNDLLNSFTCNNCLKHKANLEKFFKFSFLNRTYYFIDASHPNEIYLLANLETFLFKLWIIYA